MSTKRRPVPVVTMVDGIGVSGGAERLAAQVAVRLDRERFRPLVCVTRWEPSEPALAEARAIEAAGVELIGLRRSLRLDARPWSALVRRMRAERPRPILHTHKFGSNAWGTLVAPAGGASVFVAHEHTWSYEGDLLRRLADRRLIAPRADAFVAVSEQDRRRMEEVERIPAGKLRFVPNGISDLPPPDPARDVRAELGIGSERPLVGVVAAVREQKALDVLLRAASSLRRDHRDLAVLIAGSSEPGNPMQVRLEQLASELGLSGSVHMLGHRSDIAEVLAALDVAVLSSDYEGSPLSVMEYMAAGKPVVATRVGGVPDLVVEGHTGLLVPPRDPVALAGAISRILTDPSRARAMGEAGRERQRREFSIDTTTRQVEALYEELLEATPSR